MATTRSTGSLSRIAQRGDYLRSLGSAGIGGRLRRLVEQIDRDAKAIYSHCGLQFEQRWMGIVGLLAEHGKMTVGELAEALVITQPSVSQSLRSLQAAKLVAERQDPRDARRRIQRLTRTGRAFVKKVRPVWDALIESARDLDREGIDLATPLDQVEEALGHKSLYERALGYLSHGSR